MNDHMPLTYWITASVFKILGPTDFAARLYPMFCSVACYLLVFSIGRKYQNVATGLAATLSLGLCFEFTKWNGSLMQDAPLAFYLLGGVYFFLRGLEEGIYFYGAAVCFALGVLTKGPIVGCLPLGILFWSFFGNKGFYRSIHFWLAIGFSLFILSILFWPPFLFQGRNYYSIFYEWKAGYFSPGQTDWGKGFVYVQEVASKATLPLLFLLLLRKRRSLPSYFWLVLAVAIALFIPLSLAKVKFPHYLLPFYPLLAVLAGEALGPWVKKHQRKVELFLRGAGLIAVFALVFMPIKTSGKRSKELLNLVNAAKLDSRISEKRVYFLGGWETDMAIYQTFKFYGNIDLAPIDHAALANLDSSKAVLVLPLGSLPVRTAGGEVQKKDCLFLNDKYCLFDNRETTQFNLPLREFPHEIY